MIPSISCIIPAWNEADRLGAVLDAVIGHPDLIEVIVVDDASSDATARVAREKGAQVLRHFRNRGKSAAVASGLEAAQGDLILLLDADLIGLTAQHVSQLIDPVLKNRADVSISLRANAPLFWRVIGLDYISGERVFSRSLCANQVDRIRTLGGFGLEVFFNELWISRHLKIRVVALPISSPMKSKKQGLVSGLINDICMISDIVKTVGVWRVGVQILSLRRLSDVRQESRIGPETTT